MTIEATLYSKFSDVSYTDDSSIDGQVIQNALDSSLNQDPDITPSNEYWQVLSIEGKYVTTGEGGFAAVAFGLDSNGDGVYEQVVIAYRGSNDFPDFAVADWQIACGETPYTQSVEAEAFYDLVKYNYGINNGNNISITGHSLGGALAQLISADHGNYAVTFNAPGMESQAEIYEYTHKNVLNYVIMNDIVGNLGDHVGNTLYYTPTTTSNGLGIFQPHVEYINTDFSKYFSYSNWSYADVLALAMFDVNNPIGADAISSLVSALSKLSNYQLISFELNSYVVSNNTLLKVYLETVLPDTINQLEKDFGEKSLLGTVLKYSTISDEYILGTKFSESDVLTGRPALLGVFGGDDHI